MAKSTTLAVVVNSVRKMRNTVDGNPRYELTTDHGVFTTKPNMNHAYGLESVFSVGSEIDQPSILTLDGRRNVTDWT